LISSLAFLCGLGIADAQAVPTANVISSVAVDAESGIPMPLQRGLSFSSATNVAHDSLSGWSMLESPAFSYRFNEKLSVDASVPYYPYINAVRTTKLGVSRLVGQTNELGDTAVAGHVEVRPWGFDYINTVAVSFPTGDQQLGLSSGRVSYDINNHIERGIWVFTPDVELGIGDTSGLFRQRIRKNYVSSGTLALFQLGSSIDLPAALSLDVEGYEQLPVAGQTVFSRTLRKNGTVLKQASSAEDNGISVELNGSLFKHIVLGAIYNRSLRLAESTEGLSLTFLFHIPPGEAAR
jgi:hypothetical protein